jgi:hypothetical protein
MDMKGNVVYTRENEKTRSENIYTTLEYTYTLLPTLT